MAFSPNDMAGRRKPPLVPPEPSERDQDIAAAEPTRVVKWVQEYFRIMAVALPSGGREVVVASRTTGTALGLAQAAKALPRNMAAAYRTPSLRVQIETELAALVKDPPLVPVKYHAMPQVRLAGKRWLEAGPDRGSHLFETPLAEVVDFHDLFRRRQLKALSGAHLDRFASLTLHGVLADGGRAYPVVNQLARIVVRCDAGEAKQVRVLLCNTDGSGGEVCGVTVDRIGLVTTVTSLTVPPRYLVIAPDVVVRIPEE